VSSIQRQAAHPMGWLKVQHEESGRKLLHWWWEGAQPTHPPAEVQFFQVSFPGKLNSEAV